MSWLDLCILATILTEFSDKTFSLTAVPLNCAEQLFLQQKYV